MPVHVPAASVWALAGAARKIARPRIPRNGVFIFNAPVEDLDQDYFPGRRAGIGSTFLLYIVKISQIPSKTEPTGKS
jgi:hypothetical protein